MKRKKLTRIHPGIWLKEEYLDALGLTAYRLAKDLHSTQTTILAITKGQRRITAEMGLKLDRYFSKSPGFWYGLMSDFESEEAQRSLGPRIKAEVQPLEMA